MLAVEYKYLRKLALIFRDHFIQLKDKIMQHAYYRKINDRTCNSSTYHKKDCENIRAKLKTETQKELLTQKRADTDLEGGANE